jgi:hypothetical protein
MLTMLAQLLLRVRQKKSFVITFLYFLDITHRTLKGIVNTVAFSIYMKQFKNRKKCSNMLKKYMEEFAI